MAILRGQEALDYIQQKQASMQPSGIGKVLRGIEDIPVLGAFLRPATATAGKLMDYLPYAIESLMDPQGTGTQDYQPTYDPEGFEGVKGTFDEPMTGGEAAAKFAGTALKETAPALQLGLMTTPVKPVESVLGKTVSPTVGAGLGVAPLGAVGGGLAGLEQGEDVDLGRVGKGALMGAGIGFAGGAGTKALSDKLKGLGKKPAGAIQPKQYGKYSTKGKIGEGQIATGKAAGGTQSLKIDMEDAINSGNVERAKTIYKQLPALEQTSMYKRQIEKIAGESWDNIHFLSSVNDDAVQQVWQELDVAEPGKVISAPSDEFASGYSYTGQKSTIPDWIPESMRKVDVIDEVKEALVDMRPPRQGTLAKDLYDLSLQRAGFGETTVGRVSTAQTPQLITERETADLAWKGFDDELGATGLNAKVGTPKLGLRKKLAEGLRGASEKVKTYSWKKTFGGLPRKADGGAGLLDEMAGTGRFKLNNIDELSESIDDVFATEGSKIRNATQKLSQEGVAVDVSDIKTDLNKVIQTEDIPELKRPLEKVLTSFSDATEGSGSIDIDKLYNLKQGYGKMGNWNQFSTAGEKSAGQAYNKLYMKLNDKLDDALTTGGFKEFREVNKLLHLANKAQRFATERMAAERGMSPIQFMDIMAGSGGFMAGGPMGGGAAMLGQRFLRSPKGAATVSKGLGGLADVLESGKGPKLPKVDLGKFTPALNQLGTGMQAGAPYVQKTAPYAGTRMMLGARQPDEYVNY